MNGAYHGHSPSSLLAQTTAACDNSFAWMQNNKGQSPCLVAAYTQGACQNGDWLVAGLTPGNQYTSPNATTANVCNCSWATYNLLSACTACQGFSPSNWDSYRLACGALTSTSFFPGSITLPSATSIPYWAGTNPSTWPDAHFNTASARSLANENHPDLTNNSNATTPKKSSPIGAIVGGVVGGTVFLFILALLLCLLRRRRRLKQNMAPSQMYMNNPQGFNGYQTHNRQQSLNPLLGQTPPHSQESPPSVLGIDMHPTRQQHSPSGFTGGLFGGGQGQTNSSLNSFGLPFALPMAVENVIEPFVSQPPSNSTSSGRTTKGAPPGADRPSGQPPMPGRESPHTQRMGSGSGDDDTLLVPTNSSFDYGNGSLASSNSPPPRARMNPPAYTPGGDDSAAGYFASGRGEKGGRRKMTDESQVRPLPPQPGTPPADEYVNSALSNASAVAGTRDSRGGMVSDSGIREMGEL